MHTHFNHSLVDDETGKSLKGSIWDPHQKSLVGGHSSVQGWRDLQRGLQSPKLLHLSELTSAPHSSYWRSKKTYKPSQKMYGTDGEGLCPLLATQWRNLCGGTREDPEGKLIDTCRSVQ